MSYFRALSVSTTLSIALLAACGGGTDTPVAAPYSPPTSLGADGWATYYASGTTGTTQGGAAADAAHTYTVTTRAELIKALYGDAKIASDGTFTKNDGTAATVDNTAKIIYVSGTISLNTDGNNKELTEADYACTGYSFEAYKTAYNPKEWNKQALVNGKPPKPSGALETARSCSANNQAKIVKLAIGSNTSLLGLKDNAKIVHGQLSIGDGTNNVVIRNITFEDAFDMFPTWDPTDSFGGNKNYVYVAPPTVADAGATYPKCQSSYDATTDNGPHQCGGGRWNSNYDLIGLSGGTHIWIDHCTFSDGDRETWKYPSVWSAPFLGHEYAVEHHDGAVDITLKSNFVTLSYNRIMNHQKSHLIGSSDSVSVNNGWGALSVTLHHNYYDNAGERLPRVRLGKVHIYNNYYTGVYTPSLSTPPDYGKTDPDRPFIYGIGIGYLAKIYSENNVFDLGARAGDAAPDETATYFVWHKAAPTTGTGLDLNQSTYFYDSGSMLNGVVKDFFAHATAASVAQNPARPALTKTDTYWKPSTDYSYTTLPAISVKADVVAKAGAGKL